MSDLVTGLLFENLAGLLLLEAVVVAVALGLYRRSRSVRSRRGVWLTLLACAALVGVQKLVVTDREAIRAMVEAMALAVQEGDVPALGEHFAADMIFEHDRGKEAVLSTARTVLQRYDIQNARVSGFSIAVAGDEATAAFQAMADVRGGGIEPTYNTPTRWNLKCRREADGWKVYQARYELGLAGLRF